MPRFDCGDLSERRRGVDMAVAAAGRNQLVAFPTDVAYGVACDAFSEIGIERLNVAKGRLTDAGLPVMVGTIRAAKALIGALAPAAELLIDGFWPGALTVVCPVQSTLHWDLGGDGRTVTVRMPLHPVALEVLQRVGPMVVVSANRVGQPVPLDCDSAAAELDNAVSVYLDGGACPPSPPSTVVDLTLNPPRLMREGAITLDELRSVAPDLRALEVPEGELS